MQNMMFIPLQKRLNNGVKKSGYINNSMSYQPIKLWYSRMSDMYKTPILYIPTILLALLWQHQACSGLHILNQGWIFWLCCLPAPHMKNTLLVWSFLFSNFQFRLGNNLGKKYFFAQLISSGACSPEPFLRLRRQSSEEEGVPTRKDG